MSNRDIHSTAKAHRVEFAVRLFAGIVATGALIAGCQALFEMGM